MKTARLWTSIVALALTCACSSIGLGDGRSGTPGDVTPAIARTRNVTSPAGSYIKHVVVIIQENRTFENIFAGYKGADAPMFAYDHNGNKVMLHQVPIDGPDLGHDYATSLHAYDSGKMDFFDLNVYGTGTSKFGQPAGTYPFAYVNRHETAPYWSMAHQYVLADHMFPTEFGASFTAHLDLIAGTDNVSPRRAEVDYPPGFTWGCDAGNVGSSTLTPAVPTPKETFSPNVPPCFTQFRTMADTLDAAGISWKYYASDTGMGWIWSIFQAIHNVRYGPDWNTSIIHPETTILSDAASGNLAGVSWVTPDFYNSDHGGVDHTSGPSWVSAIVNAVGTGPEWNSTAIVVLWDDWGGWYDNVPPPQKDFRGLGIRVPCIIISPYAAKGHVSHTQYEFGSVLKFIEQVFSIPSLGPTSLGYTDRRSNSFLDDDGSFDFTKPPRPFVAIKAPLPASYFFHAAPSHRAPDDD